MKDFPVISPEVAAVKECPRGETCGMALPPALADSPTWQPADGQSNPNARIQWANPRLRPRLLNAVEMLDNRAITCGRREDAAFWILTSAAAHLNGYDLNDGNPSSSVAVWWNKR